MNMKYCSIFILLSGTMNVISAKAAGICSNASIGEPLQCCENYRQVGEACEECWPGTYTSDCIPCPSDFYGRFCQKSCNQCKPCDAVTGCATSKNSAGRFTNEDTQRRTQWIAITISVAGSFSVVFVTLMCIYCTHIRTTTSKRCHENQVNSAPGMLKNNLAYGLTITRENDLVITLPS